MRDITNEAIYHEAIRDLFATPPTVEEHLRAVQDWHDEAARHLREARNVEKWGTRAHLAPALRLAAADDHLAATDTLRAAVVELAAIVQQLSAENVGLRELIEARDAKEGRAA